MIFMIDQFVFWRFITWSIVYNDRQHAQTSIKTVPDPFSFINLQLVLVLVLALTWVSWCCSDSLPPAGGASSLCTDPRPGAADLRGGLRPGWALNRVQEPGTRNQDQDCLQMVHIPAGLRGAPENHRNVLSSRLPANVNAPATRLHRVLKDACTRLRAACRPELNRSRVQTVTERQRRRSVNQTRRCRRSLIVLIWDLWASQKPALTSGDRSIR